MTELLGPRDAGPVPAGEAPAAGTPISVTNPLSSQHSVLRQSLVGSLLEVVGTNLRQGRDGVAIFEVGKGYGRVDDRPAEWWRLGIALSGPVRPPHPSGPARAWDLDDVKGLVELLCRRLTLGRPVYVRLSDDPTLHPGRSATVSVPPTSRVGPGEASGGPLGEASGRLLGEASRGGPPSELSGRIGEVHPALLDALDLRAGRVLVAELAISGLSGGQARPVVASPVPRFPAVERDLAVILDESRDVATVEGVIRDHGYELLREVILFDIYRGAPLAATEKSLAFRLHFQALDRTLTDDEIDTAMGTIATALREELGGRLRA